jgi:hypothetical protein
MLVGPVAGIRIGLLHGFVTGGRLHRQSLRWCPKSGATTSAERPSANAAQPQQTQWCS